MRDLLASISKAIKEIKRFKRIILESSEWKTVEFTSPIGSYLNKFSAVLQEELLLQLKK